MKRTILAFGAALIAVVSYSQTSPQTEIPYANTIKVQPLSGIEELKEKAVHVVPTPNQVHALEDGFTAFVHFGPNTFSRREWGTGLEDPRMFDLKTLDTDQWVKAMKDAGMKKVLLTVKHHDGFVLWQSRYTDHGIMSTGFRDGKGDILADLAESCRKQGLKLGVYLSPADLYHIERPDGLYGNQSPKTTRTIPREVEGRPFKNKITFTFDSIDDYNEYFLNQLYELLTEYGEMDELWFDGAHPKQKGGQTYNRKAWMELIHTLAPNAVVFGYEDIRWCGNEAGDTRSTEWNVIGYPGHPITSNARPVFATADLGSLDVLSKAEYLHYQPAETDTSIREGWFYRDDDTQRTRSANDVFDIYERSVGGNAILLLNIPPNREGRFSQTDVDVLEEVGKRIRETYGTNLLAGANTPVLLDGDITTFIKADTSVIITLPQPVTVNRFMIQEPVSVRGERIESLKLLARVDGEWKEVAECTNVGFKRILRFADVTTDCFQITITGTRAEPYIAEVSAHYYEARPPQLDVVRALDGTVTIEPKRDKFEWKTSGENAAANLSTGMIIRYTTDGSNPSESSTVYTGPFTMDCGTVNAMATVNNENGPVTNARFGYIKDNWVISDGCGAEEKHPVAAAFDANPATYWKSTGLDSTTLVIDLGADKRISGFTYTPQTVNADGMVEEWNIKVSKDGKKWTDGGTYSFGNLINDPSPREQHLTKALNGRYVKLIPIATAQDSPCVTVAEMDIF